MAWRGESQTCLSLRDSLDQSQRSPDRLDRLSGRNRRFDEVVEL